MEETSTMDVQDLLNSSRFSPFQWLIFAMCFLIVLMDGFDTAAIGFIAPSLVTEWHLSKAALAPVLSAALFGLAAGALISGPVADAWGRRMVLVIAVLLFGGAALASAFANNLGELTALRFVTGVGLGAAMPNACTVMSEFCPERRRATIVNLMFCGFPLGAAFGGFLAAWMIPLFGWRGVLIFGGAVPLVLAVALLAFMPESIRFLVSKGVSAERIRSILVRINSNAASATSFTMAEAAKSDQKGGVATVLSKKHIFGSVMLWVCYFMGLVIFYGLVNWMPLLFRDAGLNPHQAAMISALFPLGGVGTVLCGMLMDRFDADRVVATCFALGAISVYAVGHALGGQTAMLMLAVLVAGLLVNTSLASMPSLAAAFYPTSGRGTGVAWMLGVGRFGGIAGSFLVAELSRHQFTLAGIFTVVAIAGLIASGALVAKRAISGRLGANDDTSNEGKYLAH
ncbi:MULTISPECIES: MFS transporter [Burkholderiaceae]|uniref:4-hydroxybenzoate transporter n=1 Tax=Caballeronia zhejiangensis TaxID=871203 RepID=A0A656QCL9_9BURK|nr:MULTISPECIES: MFS transporter [Burkholderiaceae]KAK43829.1 4-hydroxybenzoate transporter [Caballeronia jiangsuensis]KDR25878.1 4-hydroxybenzoate transporter [Caballeronia zhejiangensis]KWU23787.1 4-hydroxybenzoate transporter [Burkholderia cenocepacia]SAL78329.1 major facilitator transporter [Caballeronia peredens]